MYNVLIVHLEWATDNLSLAMSLPESVMIRNAPDPDGSLEIDALLEERIGLPPRGYDIGDIKEFMGKDGRKSCVVLQADFPVDKYTPVVEMYRAMKVLALTKETREYLDANDPKALEQLLDAITAAETLPEIRAYQVKDGLVRAPLPEWATKPPRTKLQDLVDKMERPNQRVFTPEDPHRHG